jgi:HTH-type transcriptional regulator / antitoxin HigA
MTRIDGKMTLTINRERYAELLSLYQPRVIKTEAENESFLAIVEELMARSSLTLEEDVVLELLVRLIEEFEQKHYAIAASSPHSRLLHLMEARSLGCVDLVNVLGSLDVAEAIVEGRSLIGREQSVALGQFFDVDSALFFYT